MLIQEIPLQPSVPQTLGVQLPDGNTYRFRFIYCDVDNGGWIMDIADDSLNMLICGMALTTGCNLLDPFAYLNIGGPGVWLIVVSDGFPDDVPTFDNLGVTSHLYVVTVP